MRVTSVLTGVSVVAAVIVVCLACILAYFESGSISAVEYACRLMAESAEAIPDSQSKIAFIVGYTGGIGKALVKYLDKNKTFSKVKLIGRRDVKLELDNPELFEQIIVDFEKLEGYEDAFRDATVGFCTLGTTRGKAGHDGFIRVDHDYVVKVGEIAKGAGCLHYSVVTSRGSDKNSSLLYLRTKGQAEEALKVFHFDRLSIFRPALLLEAEREDTRITEKLFKFFMKPITYLAPTTLSIPVEAVAKALVVNSLTKNAEIVEVFENKPIHALAGTVKCGQE